MALTSQQSLLVMSAASFFFSELLYFLFFISGTSKCFQVVISDKYSTNSLYLFLHLRDLKDLPDPDSSMMIELALSILDQKHGKHFFIKGPALIK
jgi:hypothetical protein